MACPARVAWRCARLRLSRFSRASLLGPIAARARASAASASSGHFCSPGERRAGDTPDGGASPGRRGHATPCVASEVGPPEQIARLHAEAARQLYDGVEARSTDAALDGAEVAVAQARRARAATATCRALLRMARSASPKAEASDAGTLTRCQSDAASTRTVSLCVSRTWLLTHHGVRKRHVHQLKRTAYRMSATAQRGIQAVETAETRQVGEGEGPKAQAKLREAAAEQRTGHPR